MRTALIAIDPLALKGQPFERFCEKVRFLQDKEFLSRTSVASIINSSQYLMPYSYYGEHKDELAKEARFNVRRACAGKFQHQTVRVLQSTSSSNEEIVERLSRQAKRMGLGVLVIGSNDRGGLPYWYLGSLAETAALAATLPVLILKNSTPLAAVSRQPKLIIAVDVAAPPNTRDLTWLGNLSRSTKSHLSLVYVEPRHRVVIDSLQERKSKDEAKRVLRRLATSLKSKGAAATTISVLPESRSIAHAIVEFAEEEKAWMTVATTPERTRLRRLLLGSNARHILALSKRPFLSLRLE